MNDTVLDGIPDPFAIDVRVVVDTAPDAADAACMTNDGCAPTCASACASRSV